MQRYSKAIVSGVVLLVVVVAQMLGVDLGEVGTNVDVSVLIQGVVATFFVYMAKNQPPGD